MAFGDLALKIGIEIHDLGLDFDWQLGIWELDWGLGLRLGLGIRIGNLDWGLVFGLGLEIGY